MEINKYLSSFFWQLSQNYNIPITELREKWDSANSRFTDIWLASNNLHKGKEIKKSLKPNIKMCKAILKSGPRKGNSCTNKALEKTGFLFCGRHSSNKNSSFLLKKNSYGNYEHVETRFVFNKDKEVIGKQGYVGNEAGVILKLNDEDKEECKKRSFKIFKNNLFEIIFEDI